MTTIALPELLTTTDLAHRLGLSPATLQAWRVREFGPPYQKIGGAVRYRLDAVLDWLDASEVR